MLVEVYQSGDGHWALQRVQVHGFTPGLRTILEILASSRVVTGCSSASFLAENLGLGLGVRGSWFWLGCLWLLLHKFFGLLP